MAHPVSAQPAFAWHCWKVGSSSIWSFTNSPVHAGLESLHLAQSWTSMVVVVLAASGQPDGSCWASAALELHVSPPHPARRRTAAGTSARNRFIESNLGSDMGGASGGHGVRTDASRSFFT